MFVSNFFTLLDPGPYCESGYGSRDPIELDPVCKSGYGSREPIESGSTALVAGLEYERLLPMASARLPGEMKGPRCELMLRGGAAVLKERDAAAGAQLRGQRRQTEPRRLHQL
jgi:hypothetical protein